MDSHSDDYGVLGQTVSGDKTYNPKCLFPILRAPKREALGITEALPFFGIDIWNHYEVSWLNLKGKPCVAMARIIYDCDSLYLIESKSLKLYFNSLNQTSFESEKALRVQVEADLSEVLETKVQVELFTSDVWQQRILLPHLEGTCVDELDVACSIYEVDANLLEVGEKHTKAALSSDLLRSNCPVTNQPDWGSVVVVYEGPEIKPESFLKYIVSFRNHQGFHEQCIEQIFLDISKHCTPQKLTVYGRYTRRGGLDINPYRSTESVDFRDAAFRLQLIRQ